MESKDHLIKIHQYLIEKTQAFHPFTICIQLSVEIRKITDTGEHDNYFVTGLVIKFLNTKHKKQQDWVKLMSKVVSLRYKATNV